MAKYKGTFKGETLEFIGPEPARDGFICMSVGNDGYVYNKHHIERMGTETARSAMNGDYGYLSPDKKYTFLPMYSKLGEHIYIGYDEELWEKAEYFHNYVEMFRAKYPDCNY